jgi:hypothetical protein
VIQPHLPVRLPCSRGSPCRHGAWTISPSWSSTPGVEQAALPRMPRSDRLNELAVRARRDVEPPQLRIDQRTRIVELPASDPQPLEHRSKLGQVPMVLLHELDVPAGAGRLWHSAFGVEVATRVGAELPRPWRAWMPCRAIALMSPAPRSAAPCPRDTATTAAPAPRRGSGAARASERRTARNGQFDAAGSRSHRAKHPGDRPESLKHRPPGARRVVSEGSTHTPDQECERLPC